MSKTRSLYRSVLRELPPLTSKTTSTPLRASVRDHFTSTPSSQNSEAITSQFTQYLKAQRVYLALLDRYNPGAGMDEEERVRLTARRVGMDMPEEWYGNGTAGKFGVDFSKNKK